ncbi:hypothetical protein ACS0PU_006813 [Formica fusca]
MGGELEEVRALRDREVYGLAAQLAAPSSSVRLRALEADRRIRFPERKFAPIKI